MPQRNYDEKIIKAGHQVWKTMHSEATKRGMSLVRDKNYNDGRVIVGTIGAFIKALNKERGWNLAENEVDMVRRYLKASGNVVNLGKIEKYRFRIFIREEWSNAALVPKAVPERTNKTTRPSAKDLGEDREPAPVEHKCGYCGEVYPSAAALHGHMSAHRNQKKTLAPTINGDFTLSESQVALLEIIAKNGGEVSDPKGQMREWFAKQDSRVSFNGFSGAMKALEERDLIEREIRGKRTYNIALTTHGREVLKNIAQYRAAQFAVADYIRSQGTIYTDRAGGLKELLAESLGISDNRAGNALRWLENEGWIKGIKTEGGYWTGVDWIRDEPSAAITGDAMQRLEEQEPLPSHSLKFAQATDDELLLELGTRLKADAASIEEIEQYRQRLELIESLVNEAIEGKMSPLKALAEIQEAVTL